MHTKIQLPHDSCPTAEFHLDGQHITVKMNLAALDRAVKRVQAAEAEGKPAQVQEAAGWRVYEAAVEAGTDIAFDDFMALWWNQSTGGYKALMDGLDALYFPKPAADARPTTAPNEA